jgi:hypothetical protein
MNVGETPTECHTYEIQEIWSNWLRNYLGWDKYSIQTTYTHMYTTSLPLLKKQGKR